MRVEASLRVPGISAGLALPGPGVNARVGPVRVKLPTGAVYYGGLAALAVGGAVELPVALALGVAGLAFGGLRRFRPAPAITVHDREPDDVPGPGPGVADGETEAAQQRPAAGN